MKRNELDSELKKNHYLEGGTKEACVKVRDFLQHATNPGNEIHSAESCVTTDEFIEAVKTLVRFAFFEDDAIPEKWQCDCDCRWISLPTCPGKYNVCKTADEMCPFFADEGLV